jgi:DNA-binding NtrC family response regulator
MNNPSSILIVDDEQVVRLSHLRSLAVTGFEATAVGTGAEALSLLECHPYDVVFLDIRMPDTDGIALLGEIRAHWPETEVVIITGYPTIDNAKKAVRLGAYHYLVKPVSPTNLAQAARQALRYKQWALRSGRPQGRDSDPGDRRRWVTRSLKPQYARQGETS